MFHFLLLAASNYLTATVNILCYLKILIFCENFGLLTREARGTHSTKFPIRHKFRKRKEGWVGTTHRFLEENQVRRDQMKKRTKAALRGLAS